MPCGDASHAGGSGQKQPSVKQQDNQKPELAGCEGLYILLLQDWIVVVRIASHVDACVVNSDCICPEDGKECKGEAPCYDLPRENKDGLADRDLQHTSHKQAVQHYGGCP